MEINELEIEDLTYEIEFNVREMNRILNHGENSKRYMTALDDARSACKKILEILDDDVIPF